MPDETEAHFDLNGRTLEDRYRVERALDKGGMGVVYLARDIRLNDKPVVIKIPFPELLTSPQIRKRFEDEADFLIDLDHPHIVKVLDKGIVDRIPYIVLQYLSGGSLKERLEARGGQMSRREVLDWLRPIASATDFIHAQDRVHRDIKPGNILFDGQDNPFLADFGIAKALEQVGVTRTGTMPGSPAYMAPEALKAQFLPKYDQYALATVVYECLSGRLPFEASDHIALLMKKSSEVAASLGWGGNLRRALESDPEKRYPSCTAFAAALQQYIDEPSVPETVRELGQLAGAATKTIAEDAQGETQTDPVPAPAAGGTQQLGNRPSKGFPRWLGWAVPGLAVIGIAFGVSKLLPDKPPPAPPVEDPWKIDSMVMYDGTELTSLGDCGAGLSGFPVRLKMAGLDPTERRRVLERFRYSGGVGERCEADGTLRDGALFDGAGRSMADVGGFGAGPSLDGLARSMNVLRLERLILGPTGGQDSVSLALEPTGTNGAAVLNVQSNRNEHLLLLIIFSDGTVEVLDEDPTPDSTGTGARWRIPGALEPSERETLIALASSDPWGPRLRMIGVPKPSFLSTEPVAFSDDSKPTARDFVGELSTFLRENTDWERGFRTDAAAP